MRKLLILLTVLTSLAVNAQTVEKKTNFRMPECYQYGCLDVGGGCNGLAGWASAVGYGMAMYGYTNMVYEQHCCDDACFQICASYCGTPPGASPIMASGVDKVLIVSTKGLTREKAVEQAVQDRAKILKEGGQIKDFSTDGDQVTVIYTVPK